jgi:hypothetical protein
VHKAAEAAAQAQREWAALPYDRRIPFGGVGESSTGSRHGGTQANLDAFTEVQWVTVRGELPQYPF